MGTGYQVNVTDVAAAVTSMNGNHQQLEQAMRNVIALSGDLMTSWVGSTNAAYNASVEQWDAAMTQMREALLNLTRILQQNGVNYEDTDAATARLFANVG